MRLERLLPALCSSQTEEARYAGVRGLEVTAVVNNSQAVTPGALFVALRGARADGHAFIPNAVRAGAVAVVSERPASAPPDVAHFVLPDARRRTSQLAALFHEDPTARLHVTGVTGTNGKTTATYRTKAILEAAGHRTGLIGTIVYEIGERVVPAGNTTPDGVLIQDLFGQMAGAGASHAVIEVSSHALDLGRVEDVRFDTGVFTCLSDREHLDYHGTFERYRDAKARLFERLPRDGCAVLNADDPSSPVMAERAPCPKLWFGLGNRADVTAEIRAMDMSGSAYRLRTPAGSAEVRTAFVGEYNVSNDLAAAGAAVVAGVGLDAIVAGLESAAPVPGRLERVPGADFDALVDYAHNEGALDSVLRTVRALAPRRLIVVVGAGGDRDPSKRRPMGAVAEKYCDLIFLTADNSRSEDTLDILDEIERGMTGAKPRFVVPDREDAIRAAVAASGPDDVLIVAGKGHETYQILNQVKAPFDDREVLRRAVAERETTSKQAVPVEA